MCSPFHLLLHPEHIPPLEELSVDLTGTDQVLLQDLLQAGLFDLGHPGRHVNHVSWE